MPAGAWIQFPNMEAYKAREQELLQAIADSDGNDDVVIYLRDIKTREDASLADCDYQTLEAKVTGKGIRLLGGGITDNMVDLGN